MFSHFSSNIFRENSREQTKIIVYCLQLYDAWVIIDINKNLREPKLYLQFLFITHNCLNCFVLLFCNWTSENFQTSGCFLKGTLRYIKDINYFYIIYIYIIRKLNLLGKIWTLYRKIPVDRALTSLNKQTKVNLQC